MKSVLVSIQPYWVFLIIAKTMGWNINKEKTVEVRKNYPKDENWDKVAKIYCCKNKQSFARIPKEYQPLMEKFLGKVIGEFVCDEIIKMLPDNEIYGIYDISDDAVIASCLFNGDLWDYGKGKTLYGWHISNLVIYDKPRELSEFSNGSSRLEFSNTEDGFPLKWSGMKRPPQSWCYVESEVDTE